MWNISQTNANLMEFETWAFKVIFDYNNFMRNHACTRTDKVKTCGCEKIIILATNYTWLEKEDYHLNKRFRLFYNSFLLKLIRYLLITFFLKFSAHTPTDKAETHIFFAVAWCACMHVWFFMKTLLTVDFYTLSLSLEFHYNQSFCF